MTQTEKRRASSGRDMPDRSPGGLRRILFPVFFANSLGLWATTMSADITAGPATGATSFVFPRLEQTFPTLTPPEIERMRRFGELHTYKHGEALFETGKPGPGMFVLL